MMITANSEGESDWTAPVSFPFDNPDCAQKNQILELSWFWIKEAQPVECFIIFNYV